MPIKFRCNYCRQFLGISRAQAGGVVDCPTCGRSIRVPMLDGTVEPMPDPELNLEDTHLTRALDELARLVDAPVQNRAPMKSALSEPDDGEIDNLIPQPLPEPIPIEVPLPPTPVVVTPSLNLGTSSENAMASEAGLLAELVALSAGTTPTSVLTEVQTSAIPTSDVVRKAAFSPLLTSLLSTILFVAGMLTERFVRVFERSPQRSPIAEKKVIVDNELTGRITFKSKGGESQPDRGARILVFPQRRTGELKLPVRGFRPADQPADQLDANAALRAMGGCATTADDRGVFRLPIEAGSYRILVLSHFQPREGTNADPELEKLLAEYFENPAELVGRVQHQFSPLRIKGTGDLWDHSF